MAGKSLSSKSVLKGVFFTVAVSLLLSFIFGGWVCRYTSPAFSFDDIPSLAGKVVIITGGNSGIGKVSARELYRKGAKVVITARNITLGNAAVQDIVKHVAAAASSNNSTSASSVGSIECMELNLMSFKNVRTFAKKFKGSYKKIDVLILNAGIMMPEFTLSEDGYESQIQTNHLGHFLLVKLLEPHIKKSSTRIVTVSSTAHEGSYPGGIVVESFTNGSRYNPVYAYGQSKLANVLFSQELAERYNGTGVTSNSLHPGLVHTELSRHVEERIRKSVLLSLLMPLFALVATAAMGVESGSLTTLYVATAPQLAKVSGKYFYPIAVEYPLAPTATAALQKELWATSEKITKKYW